MKIKKIQIENYRLLKNLSVDLEDKLSLVLGKNNTGKTSFLSLMEKFLGHSNNFSFDDFNLEFQQSFLVSDLANSVYQEKSIKLKLYIEYTEDDNLEKISGLIMNLEPTDNILILSFEYSLVHEKYEELILDFNQYQEKIKDKDLLYFLKKNHKNYFKIKKRALESDNEDNFIDIDDNIIRKVINFQSVSAKRGVANQEGNKSSDKTLSKLSSDYYDIRNKPDITDITELQKQLINTDEELNKSYKNIFKPVVETIKKFGTSQHDIDLEIKSNLEEKNILTENTLVAYNQNGHLLPEDYNGLGYMNLFAILFNIHIKIDLFKKIKEEIEPSAINLLFIEEPEAHTHPQMQYIFIKNIKDMLDEETKDKTTHETILNLQTIITTHSSHIASQSNFNDIKYFLKSEQSIQSKNLSEMELLYGTSEEEKRNFQFLKQYLTLNRAELFFTDKAIFIEGDTERILLPAMMRKLDIENKDEADYTPLLSQHISIVEVGAYSHVFEKFLDFLEIKTLIITDLDSVGCSKQMTDDYGAPLTNQNGTPKMSREKASRVVDGKNTSNASIRHYLRGKTFDQLKTLTLDEKVLKDGCLRISYQTEEANYHARSFEDSFIHLNREFIKLQKENFNSLNKRSFFDDSTKDPYELADKCIDKKTLFATDILYYGGINLELWETPKYIKEGLLWLSSK
jgi:predicted ATP-dependent endonuclease of OLD family